MRNNRDQEKYILQVSHSTDAPTDASAKVLKEKPQPTKQANTSTKNVSAMVNAQPNTDAPAKVPTVNPQPIEQANTPTENVVPMKNG